MKFVNVYVMMLAHSRVPHIGKNFMTSIAVHGREPAVTCEKVAGPRRGGSFKLVVHDQHLPIFHQTIPFPIKLHNFVSFIPSRDRGRKKKCLHFLSPS
jgi:hypothetical protein